MGSPRQTDGAMLPNIVAYIDSVQPQDEINDIWAPCAQPPNKFPWSKFRRQVESWQDKTRLNNVTQQNEGKNVLREHIIHV